jgi:Protein of unknown function (DUF1573)
MHKKLMFFWLTVSLLNACSDKKGAIIKYNSNIINLGEIKFKKEFPAKFVIFNIGDEPLKLMQATADCSCTVPEDIKNTIVEPNDSAYINFKITPAMDGFLQQNIYINNSSINENRALFLIRANVKLVTE